MIALAHGFLGARMVEQIVATKAGDEACRERLGGILRCYYSETDRLELPEWLTPSDELNKYCYRVFRDVD